MKKESNALVVLMTADDRAVAEKIARGLLDRRKAACVSIFPKGTSFYWWKGKREEAGEFLLVAKTTASLLADLVEAVKEIHSYEVPEIVALPIVGGNEEYLAWLNDVTNKSGC